MSLPPPALAGLDAIQRDVLVVLTLESDHPVGREHWLERVRDSGTTAEDGSKLQGASFDGVVAALVDCGAASEGRHGFLTVPAWTVAVIDDAQQRGRLVPLMVALRSRGRSYNVMSPRGVLLAGVGSGDAEAVQQAESLFRLVSVQRAHFVTPTMAEVLGSDIPRAWLDRLSPRGRLEYLHDSVERAFTYARFLGPDVEDAALASSEESTRAHLAMIQALRGDPAGAHARLDSHGTSPWTRGARAFVTLTEGKLAAARELFAAAGTGARGQRVDLPGVLAVVDVLLAVTSDVAGEVADVARRLQKGRRFFDIYPAALDTVEGLETFRRTGAKHTSRLVPSPWLDALVQVLGQMWMGDLRTSTKLLATVGESARVHGYTWIANEAERVVAGDRSRSLLSLFGKKESWELALDSLRVALETGEPAAQSLDKRKGKRDAELWWTVVLGPGEAWIEVDAYLVGRPGAKGTKVSTRRILDPGESAVTDQDRRVAEAVERGRSRYEPLSLALLLSLVGHPRVRDAAAHPISVEEREPSLRLDPAPTGALVRLVPGHFSTSGVAVHREGDGKLVVYRQTPLATRVLASIPAGGMVVPHAGLARLSELLGATPSGLAVQAAAAIVEETTAGDPRTHVQLFRSGGALRVRLRVVPGGATGPALRPGVPPMETMAHRETGLVRVMRDLVEEQARVDRLLDRCPILASLPQDGNDRVTRELETSLELLVELQEAADDIVVEWPAGEPLRAPVVRSLSHAHMRVKGNGTWLTVEGEVRVDESRVVAMRELVENASRAQGRFVPIGDDQWLALTDTLRKKVDALARMQRLSKDGRIPGALLSGMEGIWEGVDVSFTAAVEKRRDALESARALEVPIPRGLEAELRDYQREGFVFLARRAEAGLGACLADDMGLGKTVQAIALLLHRRKGGPALVVAPTSVRRNWENELHRFAPSLAVTRFGEGDRATQVAAAGAGDVVLVSYGLLAAAEDVLASRPWSTIVFDEAHALKNASTHRWAAARALKSDAVVALTGTPVENHAGELHALFDLLLPGMMGVRSTFDRALGSAIAEGDREAAALLRQIVRPFVLRRTKSEVLAELPPKTELVQIVPASPEHLAYYEAIRRRALEKIEAAQKAGGAQAGRARIDVLAEIMRLRRAAVDPRLVGGHEAPPGGKIDALFELVTELKAEGRRALVFSQFLEALDLARARLEEGGIECLRLDGTMSEGARADAVASFQAGRADAFLVSLKAGGVGMNLTAADFVVFLDPWWNPAVEDQATGRAHRMGQERPVTVARLVTEQTIEEKVLALHAKKRKLYEDVISEADGTGTLSVEAIGELLGA